jgi:hypothetical protein
LTENEQVEEKFYVWSLERNAWLKPAKGGYTDKLFEAGKFDYHEAVKICKEANYFFGAYPTGLCEVMVPVINNQRHIMKDMADNYSKILTIVL